MRIEPLRRDQLQEAREMLVAALPHDGLAITAEEKLFGCERVALPSSVSEQAGLRTPVASVVIEGGAIAGVMATSGRFITLLAVRQSARGRGIATKLIEDARSRSPGNLRFGDHPGNYVSPGIDVRYAEAGAFLERRGFVAQGEVENIRAPLDGNPLISAERAAQLDAQAESAGYTIRRASDPDRDQLLAFIARAFAPVWAYEAALALAGPRQALYAAWFRGVPVAFAAADGNNRGLGWFGPAGTDASHRGRGLGEALLIHCLEDVRGLPEAGVIAWIGPKAFYARSCGAVDDRRFRAYEEGARR